MFGFNYYKGDFAERAIYIFGSPSAPSIYKFDIYSIGNTGVSLIGGNGKSSASPLNFNIYLFGYGYVNNSVYYETIQKFDTTNVVNQAAALNGIYSYTDSCSNGTSIYIFGGEISSSSSQNVKMYNGNSLTNASSLLYPTSRSTSNSIFDAAYVFGGTNIGSGTSNPGNSIAKYVGSSRYTVSATLSNTLSIGSSGKLGKTKIYLFGINGWAINSFDGTTVTTDSNTLNGAFSASSSLISAIYVMGGGGSNAIRRFNDTGFTVSSLTLPSTTPMCSSGTKLD